MIDKEFRQNERIEGGLNFKVKLQLVPNFILKTQAVPNCLQVLLKNLKDNRNRLSLLVQSNSHKALDTLSP